MFDRASLRVRVAFGLILALLAVLASAGAGRAASLSDAERQWIADHPKVSVGVVADNEPYSFFRNGNTMGWTIDVLRRIEAETGLTFVPRMGAWPEIFGTFRAGGLDVIADISQTEARQDFVAFTDAYHQRRTMVFHNVDYPLALPVSVEELSDKRVGVIRDIYYAEALREAGIEPVAYDTYRDLMAALAFGWVDAVVAAEMTGNFFARENGFTNVSTAGSLALTGVSLEDFRLGVLKVSGDRDRQMLHGILEKAVAALPTDELAAITDRWLSYRSSRRLTAGPLRLLPEEQEFIAEAPPLKIGFMSDYEPFSYLEDGRGQGLAVDLAHEISAATGLAMTPVHDNWSNLLAAFRAGEIDIISNISRTEAREDFTLFTREYHRIPNAVFVRSGFGPYRGLESLKGRTVGIGRGIYYADALRARVEDVRTYPTQEGILDALATGEVDAAILALSNGNAIIRRLGLINIEIGGEFLMEGVEREDLRFGVSPRYPYARSIIDRAMSAMPTARWDQLERRWLGPAVAGMERQQPVLTSQERAHLDDKGVIRACVDPSAPPYSRIDEEGEFTGVAAAVMKHLAEVGGFSWQVVPARIWSGGVAEAQGQDCDILPFVIDSVGLGDEWTFSLPYLTLPMAVAGPIHAPFVDSMGALAGKRVGVAPGGSPVRVLARRYPNVILVEVESEAAALRGVRSGQLHAALGTLPSLAHLLATTGASDVMISGRIAEDWRAVIATPTDEPLLGAIFAKLLSGLEEEEVHTILSRQILVRIEQGIDHVRVLQFGGVAVLILALVVYWNRKLRRLNVALAGANAKLQALSMTDDLTGLNNRRHFDARIADEFGVCQRNGLLFAVAMIDADNFKRINDEMGHVFGDRCLRHLADIARRVFRREGDTLARYGGEEFVVFTLGGSHESFAERLEALRRMVEESPFRHGEDVRWLTISIGGHAAVPAPGTTPADFIDRADARLYEAKEGGRNRVVLGETAEEARREADRQSMANPA